ncbi:hypothetical protein KIF53_21035 [Chromobacterium subtsugae]|uniref:Lipoprotein n=1 Tax=Chromobacterium subtsugae TaxID=251747 RepID=A0ABS7FK73_9NEIS|nr:MULTISPECIES: hypothetical protein [Chromobacterium]KUM04868.1 hypothetical protein Cv017_12220 [Chromobacterium subtsugae]KZE84813.1 hypothetical protein AWB61_21425 [Chromobacterium sp. F49]MBW7569089.1 hypothetical protein [Chromobacterium subtsugae]MBW8290131.1 hypothetical protein [Chromobacterium subtsugae]WSE93714.1 hypothetical protein U6115_10875 [Chromobacterium subtsugae]
MAHPSPIPAIRAPRRSRAALPALLVIAALAACSTPNPNERVTGDGGSRLLKLSSKQVTVDLTPAEQQTLAQIQDKTYQRVQPPSAVNASSSALQAMGFKPVKADQETMLVEGELNRVIGVRWREAIRAIFKAKGIPLQAKPDHESVSALVTVRPDQDGETLVRARFKVTIWDTNGDSKTSTVTDPKMYDHFFSLVQDSLSGKTS